MIKLFDYLTESIFDDEEEQMSKVENSVYSDLLKGTDFSVGTDGKTIIYNPSDGYAHGVFDRRLSFGYKSISANIQKKLALREQAFKIYLKTSVNTPHVIILQLLL